MGKTQSKISPNTQIANPIHYYSPTFFKVLLRGNHQILVDAMFTCPNNVKSSDNNYWCKSGKRSKFTVSAHNTKINEDMKKDTIIQVYEFGGVSNSTTSPETSTTSHHQQQPNTVLVLQDWMGVASDMGPLVQSLANVGFRVVVFDLFNTQAFSESKDAGGYIYHALASIQDTYNPEFIVCQGATCIFTISALKSGLFPGIASTIMLSPIDDYTEYIKQLCSAVEIEFNHTIVSGVEEKLGIDIPESIATTIEECSPINFLILLTTTSRELQDANLIKNAYARYGSIKCVQMVAEPHQVINDNQMHERVAQYFKAHGSVSSPTPQSSSITRMSQYNNNNATSSLSRIHHNNTNSIYGSSSFSYGGGGTAVGTGSSFNNSSTSFNNFSNVSPLQAFKMKKIQEEEQQQQQMSKMGAQQHKREFWEQEDVIPTFKRVQERKQTSLSLDNLIAELEIELE